MMNEKELLNSCNAYRNFFNVLLDEAMAKVTDPAAMKDADTWAFITETKNMLADCTAITLMLFKADILEQRVNAVTPAEIRFLEGLQAIEEEAEPMDQDEENKTETMLKTILNKLKKPN